ncbi:MAG: hypothetical protein L6R37_008254 [Teloschistes peruensis]|nr:MAG: hypothetical protein L6R37_008254 [Teloschistes peruensis]
MALLNQVVGPERIGKAMGYTSTAVSSGLLLGPVVGGFLYEFGGYFAVFYPAFGLLLMEAILRLLVIEGKAAGGPDGRRHVIDSTSDPTHKHGSPTPKHALSAANDGGTADKAGDSETAVLLVKPRVSSNAPLVLLGSPRLLTAILGNFALVSIGCGFDAVLTPYIKDEFDLKATHAAALFLCLGLPMFLAPISGALTDRYGAKWPVASGFAIAIPSLILLRLVTTGTSQPFLKLAILLFFIGIAIALAISPLNAEAPKVVKALERKSPGVFGPYGVYTQAYGLMNAASAAGAMVGPLYTGFVRVWLGWGAMSLSLGIICVVMLVLVISFSGEKPGRGDDTTERSDEGA